MNVLYLLIPLAPYIGIGLHLERTNLPGLSMKSPGRIVGDGQSSFFGAAQAPWRYEQAFAVQVLQA